MKNNISSIRTRVQSYKIQSAQIAKQSKTAEKPKPKEASNNESSDSDEYDEWVHLVSHYPKKGVITEEFQEAEV